jgi:hypothetical protein
MGSSCNSYRYNDFQPKVDSNPIAPRVRRKRQRLPPNLLIENASNRDPLRAKVCPEAFPIKASGYAEVIWRCRSPVISHLWLDHTTFASRRWIFRPGQSDENEHPKTLRLLLPMG